MGPSLLPPSLALLVVLLVLLALLQHRLARRAERSALADRDAAVERGSHRAQLQYPWVDLSRCIGCGICVRVCPEDQVLAIIHGQAQVVHGSRCVGHARCVDACPVQALRVTIEGIETRRDIPAIDARREAVGSPGLFLAGEITGFSLVRTAITHGTEVAREAVRRLATGPALATGEQGLLIVGSGPAGLACALEAKRLGLEPLVIEQETLGGTVAQYPRRKLVMTRPVELPLHGVVDRTELSKEELIELWTGVTARAGLRILERVRFEGLERIGDGYDVRTSRGSVRARSVCLAIGRRGSPRKLEVPGEELPKVAYSLVDAQSYRGRRILVVGGGDSAIEAAVGLAEQEGNRVTLSYRKETFTRIKSKNELRIAEFAGRGRVELRLGSEVESIEPAAVTLVEGCGGARRASRIANDDVFIFAGGVPPVAMLEAAGVSFRPEDRPPLVPLAEKGTGLLIALGGVALFLIATVAWWFIQRDYYALSPVERLAAPEHRWLRPAGGFGLAMGVLALLAMGWNLAYLLRRSRRGARLPGTLGFWMSSHVFTGMLALVAAFAHAAGSPRPSPGGHALLLMALVVGAGAIGRYLYSFVPRAANGRELALGEARAELLATLDGWTAPEGSTVDLAALKSDLVAWVERDRWEGSFLRRIARLVTSGVRARRWLRGRRDLGAGLAPSDRARFERGLSRAHRAALAATHWEDVRGILATWRYLHRWLAFLLVLVVLLHVAVALRYASFGSTG